MKPRAKTMILVDEFALRRASLHALLLEWFQGEGEAILEMDMARATIHLEVEPDAQLILLNLGGGSLEDTQSRHSLRLLRGIAPKAPIAIIGERESTEEIQLAMRLGAQAFLPTSLDPDFVMTCLRFLKKGGSYFPTESLLAAVEDAAGDGNDDDGERRVISGGKGPALTRESSHKPSEAEEDREEDPSAEADGEAESDAEEVDAAAHGRGERTVAFATRERGRVASILRSAVPPPIRSVGFHPAEPRARDARSPQASRPPYAGDMSEEPRTLDLEASERRAEPFPRSARGAPENGGGDGRNAAAAGEGPPANAPRAEDPLAQNPLAQNPLAQDPPPTDRDGDQGVAPHLLLTPRQVEVLQLLKRGYSNKQIARKLSTTEPTVKVHVRQIIKKFGVENRTQVVWSLFQSGKAPI